MTPTLILAVATETGIDFRAWMEPEPTPRKTLKKNSSINQGTKNLHKAAMDKWLTSYQTFRAADNEQCDAIVITAWTNLRDQMTKQEFANKIQEGIDVTSIVEIREGLVYLKHTTKANIETIRKALEDNPDLYKQPTAICPACNHPREVLTGVTGGEEPDIILAIDHAIAELKTCYKKLGYESSNVLKALEDLSVKLKLKESNHP